MDLKQWIAFINEELEKKCAPRMPLILSLTIMLIVLV